MKPILSSPRAASLNACSFVIHHHRSNGERQVGVEDHQFGTVAIGSEEMVEDRNCQYLF